MTKHPNKKGKLRFSQSLGKDVNDYLNGQLCGHILNHKWIEGKEVPGSDAMEIGTYWEYVSFKNLPKSGVTPKPKYQASKFTEKRKVEKYKNLTDEQIIEQCKFGVNEMYAPYANAHKNAERTRAYFDAMGIEIIDKGKKYVKGEHEGTIDLLVRFTKDIKISGGQTIKAGTIAVIDAKYSGLIEDRWSRHGWQWTDEQKAYHGMQAKEYHYLTELDVYFFIKDPGDNDICAFWKTEIDPEVPVVIEKPTIKDHVAEAKKTLSMLNFTKDIGFTPYPELKRCSECVLKETCVDRALFPELKKVNLSI